MIVSSGAAILGAEMARKKQRKKAAKKKRATKKAVADDTRASPSAMAEESAPPPVTPATSAPPRVEHRKTFLSPDLMQEFALSGPTYDVILEVNADMPGGAEAARNLLLPLLGQVAPAPALGVFGLDAQRFGQATITFLETDGRSSAQNAFDLVTPEGVALAKSLLPDRYVFARLRQSIIERLVRLSVQFDSSKPAKPHRLLHKAWLDRTVTPFVFRSSKTIKADAAAIAFSAQGDGIVWAVADTGIDGGHPHFKLHNTLELPQGLRHLDFTASDISFATDMASALTDAAGHGTHVAGIIAGETRVGQSSENAAYVEKTVISREIRHSETDLETIVENGPARITGVAPLCKIMSLKVLDDDEEGKTSTLIAAIGYILRANDYGYRIRIHGLNLSVGYEFEAKWFATGRSPLCNEVDRLVKSGVVVVVAAGNSGYGRVNTAAGTQEQASFAGTIADPGNAELAITVGSTHRDSPHAYGVSYFSSKGPTADGRAKPDLIAPGERIISCDSKKAATPGHANYREASGTSMAAPHVSGAVAAFLSIRNEFIGRPDAVKDLFLSTATDLKRMPHYQGRGLVDLMRAIQAI